MPALATPALRGSRSPGTLPLGRLPTRREHRRGPGGRVRLRRTGQAAVLVSARRRVLLHSGTGCVVATNARITRLASAAVVLSTLSPASCKAEVRAVETTLSRERCTRAFSSLPGGPHVACGRHPQAGSSAGASSARLGGRARGPRGSTHGSGGPPTRVRWRPRAGGHSRC